MLNRCLGVLCCTAVIYWAGATARSATIYVSPSGSDANPGSAQLPVRTISRARDIVRPLLFAMTDDITVEIEAGIYPMDGPVVFGSEDSGRNGRLVRYRNASGSTTILYGGKIIGGWTLHDAQRDIWQARVTGADNFRQIYVNGVKAIRARSVGDRGLKKTESGFSTSPPWLADFRDAAQMEIVVRPHVWQEERLPIAAIEGSRITIQEPCWGVIKKGEYPGYGNPVRVENAYELLTEPGYWYLNRATATLFYKPRPGENMATATIEVPVAEQLLALAGSAAAPVENLEFAGVSFRMTNWLRPSTCAGFLTSQANQPEPQNNAWAINAAIDAIGAQRVTIRDCQFQQLGGNGINLLTASRNDLIDRCTFHDLAASAIQIGRGSRIDCSLPPGDPDIVSRITVSNCTVHDVATDYSSGCGIFVGTVQQCTIAHNELYNLPYTAISLGWGWRRPISYTADNKIIYNKIHDHMRALADGGGIYCNGSQRAGLIEGNFVYNQGNIYGAYYLDDGSTNWTVTRNVCQLGGADEWYLFKGHNNHAIDNYTNSAKVRDMSDHTVPCTVIGTTVVTGDKWPREAVEIMRVAGPILIRQ